MAYRIHPLWWPVLAASSPILLPVLYKKNRAFQADRERAEILNRERLAAARPLDLPELEFLEIHVLSEWFAGEGYRGEAGVSYLIRTDRGALLFDVGFGAQSGVLAHNAGRMGFSWDQVDALAISHLHLDHMGGLAASRAGTVLAPVELGDPGGRPCFLPAPAEAPGFRAEVVTGPRLLTAGLASTGPLGRGIFFMGLTEEQALVARVRDKGLVVITGCGHPTIQRILEMVRRLSDLPLYAVAGGLHFPLKQSRGTWAGIQFQMILGTGKPIWEKLTDEDLDRSLAELRAAGPKFLYLSGHDSDDHALARLSQESGAQTQVLKAGDVIRV
jgi:7,8-dihydropterin-6-yl-methyl-4-(beta-D-ribofuranosyl)aminobenzene 5'-phosphate synthase